MQRWLGCIVPGVITGLFALFLFWFLNRIYQVNQVGWLEQQPWPISDWWMWGLAGFILGAVGEAIRLFQQDRQTDAAREVARRLGHKFSESCTLPDGAERLPMLAGWSEGRNLMDGSESRNPFHLFDCTTVTGSGKSRTTTRRTVVLLPVGELPEFEIHPRSFAWRMALLFTGLQGLQFAPSGTDSAEDDIITRFSQKFQLIPGSTNEWMLSLLQGQTSEKSQQRELALRQLFQPGVMAVLNQYPTLSLQAAAGFLAVWQERGTLPAAKRAELLESALQVRDALVQRPRSSGNTPLPVQAGADSQHHGRRLQGSILGGGIGVFTGFVLTAVIMPWIMSGLAGGEMPAVSFLLLPLLFFGLTIGGGALGSLLGSRFPFALVKESHTPQQKKALGCAGVVGFFGGFFVGGLLFMGSKILFAWETHSFPLEGSIFFGSIMGCALAGAILAVVVVGRWFSKGQD